VTAPALGCPALGCIADDYTGGTDVAAALRRAGLPTVLLFGEPDGAQELPECDAVVAALKSRTIPAADAVAVSLWVFRRLAAWGVRQTYFKYCSTFDSTDEGNIGPVTDALLDAVQDGSGDVDLALICPASPEHGPGSPPTRSIPPPRPTPRNFSRRRPTG
jgi:uncharacterized protein YgbK (DUF1537 family)